MLYYYLGKGRKSCWSQFRIENDFDFVNETSHLWKKIILPYVDIIQKKVLKVGDE